MTPPQNLRQQFLDFFRSKAHTVVPSDSLVPSSDPTLLFTSAGMVQFKAHFLQQIPLTFHRATSSQRCLRTTDIDNVGLTARHLTFFEMLGNFSFGDYFKDDAIAWSWEFLTKVLGLSTDRLWVSVYRDDDEAEGIWKKLVAGNRIVRMGEESNFWTMGPTGPCGPCSEIYWDRGDGPSKGPDDTDRWMEIWNLVFTQFDRQDDGQLLPLPKKNIDTGMGLERLASVVEGVSSNFDTSFLKPLVRFGEEALSYCYGSDARRDVSMRIVADHLRAVTFLIHDGILPSNEGRGYVLRRLLRRATRQGTLFGKKEPFLHRGVALVTELMKDTAADLASRSSEIATRVREEEERFLSTIDTGSDRLKELMEQASKKKAKSVSGVDVFRLYDTYGFPPELTREMLAERKLTFDENEFSSAKAAAQATAREGWKGSGAIDVSVYNDLRKRIGGSRFCGYDTLTVTGPVLAILKEGREIETGAIGDDVEVVGGETPFYPEGGGQVGDRGGLYRGNQKVADVLDTQKPVPDLIVHRVKTLQPFKKGEPLEFRVDADHREPTKRHHTATHLMHAALRKLLGSSVQQAGSLVAPDRLRFDYTFNRPLTPAEIRSVEDRVNEAILENLKVTPQVFPVNAAKKMGAMALFGEKYGNEVRCLLISSQGFDHADQAFSLELCGGTHVSASGDIGSFKIMSDSSLAAGVRRIEAVAGLRVLDYLRRMESSLNQLAEKLKTTPEEMEARVSKLLERQKQLEQEIRDLKLKQAQGGNKDAAPSIREVNGIRLAVNVSDGLDVKDLRTLADRMRQQIQSGVVFVATSQREKDRDKLSFVFAVTADLIAKGVDAGRLAKAAAAELKGSGGGRSDFAQGGGEGKENLNALVQKLPSLL